MCSVHTPCPELGSGHQPVLGPACHQPTQAPRGTGPLPCSHSLARAPSSREAGSWTREVSDTQADPAPPCLTPMVRTRPGRCRIHGPDLPRSCLAGHRQCPRWGAAPRTHRTTRSWAWPCGYSPGSGVYTRPARAPSCPRLCTEPGCCGLRLTLVSDKSITASAEICRVQGAEGGATAAAPELGCQGPTPAQRAAAPKWCSPAPGPALHQRTGKYANGRLPAAAFTQLPLPAPLSARS